MMIVCLGRLLKFAEHHMKLPRRKFLHLAAGAAGFPALPRFVLAQVYPARPVHIVVGFQGGIASDIIARFVGEWLDRTRKLRSTDGIERGKAG